jgi:hypothetical protein
LVVIELFAEGGIPMQKISPMKLGLAMGVVVGLGYLCWAVLVAAGWAQAMRDFMLWGHFIGPVLQVGPLAPATAAILVAFTGGAGFVAGVALGTIWNSLHSAGHGQPA